MKCTYCHQREAELHIRAIVDGEAQEHSFCRVCARKLQEGLSLPGLTLPIPFNELAKAVGDFLENLGEDDVEIFKDTVQREEAVTMVEDGGLFLHGRCHQCGCDEKWYGETTQFGCPSCYDTFREDILEYLKKEQKGNLHIGTVPADTSGESPNLFIEIRKLQENLRRLVKAERYEEAAEIRDKIGDLSSMVENQCGE